MEQVDKNDLSMNPNCLPAIDTLLDKSPAAKCIYQVRNPQEAVPPQISWKAREGQLLDSPLKK